MAEQREEHQQPESVAAFTRVAIRFCDVLDSHPTLSERQLLVEMTALLPELYSAVRVHTDLRGQPTDPDGPTQAESTGV
jgi:hypothetical protein